MDARGGTADRLARLDERLAASPRTGVAVAALVAGACVALLLVFTDIKTEGTVLYRDPGWDRHIYRLMADEGLFEVRLAPYCWRLLMPALAGWSPFSVQASFFFLTLLAVWATGPVLFLTLRARGHPASRALQVVVLFYALGWGPKFILADFWIPDGLAICLVTVLLLAAQGKQLLLFAAVLAAGALTKEAVLFAAPTYICLNLRRPLDGADLARQIGALVPAGLVLAALRLGVAHHNGESAYLATLPEDIRRFPELYAHYDYRRLFDEIAVDQRWRDRSVDAFLNYTLRPLGLPLVIFALLGLKASWRLALALLPFFALTYAQLLFATDTQRLIVLAAPALALLAAEGLAVAGRAGLRPGVTFVAAAGVFALGLAGPQRYDPPLAGQAVILAAAALTAFVPALSGREPQAQPPER